MTTEAGTELAVLRRIAEEGRQAPLLSGRHFMLWGVILSLASAYQYAAMAAVVAVPPWSLALVWFGLAALGTLASIWIGRRLGGQGSAVAIGNRVGEVAWTMSAWLLSIIATGIFLVATIAPPPGLDDPFALFALMPPLTFGVYGLAIGISASAGAIPLLKPYAILSLGLAGAATLLVGRPEQYLLFGIGIAVVCILPGIILLRREAR